MPSPESDLKTCPTCGLPSRPGENTHAAGCRQQQVLDKALDVLRSIVAEVDDRKAGGFGTCINPGLIQRARILAAPTALEDLRHGI